MTISTSLYISGSWHLHLQTEVHYRRQRPLLASLAPTVYRSTKNFIHSTIAHGAQTMPQVHPVPAAGDVAVTKAQVLCLMIDFGSEWMATGLNTALL